MTHLNLSPVIAATLYVTAATSHAATPPAMKAHSVRPNIILFMVEDMGWQDTSLPFWKEKTR